MARRNETPNLEVDVGTIVQLLERHGLGEDQPEQVAGRWIEAGFEDPDDIERLIDDGITEPERAADMMRGQGAAAGERHPESTEPRDVARGESGSRSEPGDELEQEPRQPSSPP